MKTVRRWCCGRRGRRGRRGGLSGRGSRWPARSPGPRTGQVAEALAVTAVTVGKWRRRFAEARLAGLDDSPRPGRPKAGLELTGAELAQLERWARRAKSARALAQRARTARRRGRAGHRRAHGRPLARPVHSSPRPRPHGTGPLYGSSLVRKSAYERPRTSRSALRVSHIPTNVSQVRRPSRCSRRKRPACARPWRRTLPCRADRFG